MHAGGGYLWFGLILCAVGAGFALTRLVARPSYYASQVYHLTARSHRRFAALSVAAALAFILTAAWSTITLGLLVVYIIALSLYMSSFVRGFSDSE